MTNPIDLANYIAEDWNAPFIHFALTEALESVAPDQSLFEANPARNKLRRWLYEAREALTAISPDDLGKVGLESRRSLAAAAQQFWLQRIGATPKDVTSPSGDNTQLTDRLVRYVDQNGPDGLTADFKLSIKALDAFYPLTDLYQQALLEGAARVIDLTVATLNGGSQIETLPFCYDITVAQFEAWRAFVPNLQSIVTPFTIITDKADLEPDCYLENPDGSGTTYIGPKPDGSPHWLQDNHRFLPYLIAHEHLHHLQACIYRNYDKLSSPSLMSDLSAAFFETDYSVIGQHPDIMDALGDKPEYTELFETAALAMYLKTPMEFAAIKMHRMILDGLDARLGPQPMPQRPDSDRPMIRTIRAMAHKIIR